MQIGRDALQYWSETVAAFIQERERLSPERICDVTYRDIRRDPIAAMRDVYKHFNWPFPHETEQRMRGVLANQPREQNGFHHYEASQFGLEAAEVTQRFPGYRERFDLLPQVGRRSATVGAGSSPAISEAAGTAASAAP
jgi:hypothetical protein